MYVGILFPATFSVVRRIESIVNLLQLWLLVICIMCRRNPVINVTSIFTRLVDCKKLRLYFRTVVRCVVATQSRHMSDVCVDDSASSSLSQGFSNIFLL